MPAKIGWIGVFLLFRQKPEDFFNARLSHNKKATFYKVAFPIYQSILCLLLCARLGFR